MLTLKAYAKVNLTLEVLGRRDDGYHDIVSIIQTIDLSDTVTLDHADEIDLACDRPELQNQDNLAYRAAARLRDLTSHRGGVRISIGKGIPVAAGLGGGSSDAAATLLGLNRLWELGLPIEELDQIAAQVGSDVPFFLRGGTAMLQGRGERVRTLPPADLEWMVVLTPPIDVPDKTATAYGKVTPASYTNGALTRKLEARIRGGGDVPYQFLFNAFDAAAFDVYPGLQEYWDAFASIGAREIHIAGSGPSMFAPVSQREVGTALELLLKHRFNWEAHLVSTWRHQPEAKA